MKDTELGCPKYLDKQIPCQLCGNTCLQTPEVLLMSPEDENYLLACPSCAQQLGQCATCAEIVHCSFETDPINIPKQVQTQVRRGPMVIQGVGRNPEREKATCARGCPCWNSVSNSCLRQNSLSCEKWNVKKV